MKEINFKELKAAIADFNAAFPDNKINPIGKKKDDLFDELVSAVDGCDTVPKSVAVYLEGALEDAPASDPAEGSDDSDPAEVTTASDPAEGSDEELKAVLDEHAKAVGLEYDGEDLSEYQEIILDLIDKLPENLWSALPEATRKWSNDIISAEIAAKKAAKTKEGKKAAVTKAKKNAAEAVARKKTGVRAGMPKVGYRPGSGAAIIIDVIKDAGAKGISNDKLFAEVKKRWADAAITSVSPDKRINQMLKASMGEVGKSKYSGQICFRPAGDGKKGDGVWLYCLPEEFQGPAEVQTTVTETEKNDPKANETSAPAGQTPPKPKKTSKAEKPAAPDTGDTANVRPRRPAAAKASK